MFVWLIRVVENYHELIWVLYNSMEDIRPVKESKAWWQNTKRPSRTCPKDQKLRRETHVRPDQNSSISNTPKLF